MLNPANTSEFVLAAETRLSTVGVGQREEGEKGREEA